MKNADNIEEQKEEMADLREIIRKQNQTILNIKAELDAAKQFNPFDLVLMSGSMENITTIVEDHFTSEPTTDEWEGGVIELRSWIGRLSSTVETLEAELKSVKSDRDIMYQNYHNVIAKLQDDIKGLEVELSVREGDSEVLMKVVEIVKRDDRCPTIINQLADLLVDYLDAPEGPPETPIDETPTTLIAIELSDAVNQRLRTFKDHVYHGTK